MNGDKANTDDRPLLIPVSAWTGLRWQDEKHTGASSLRTITAATGIVHAAAWTHVDGATPEWVVSSAAVVVFAACGLARLVTGRWKTLIVPAGAVLSFLAAPVNYGVEKVKVFSGRIFSDCWKLCPGRSGGNAGFEQRSLAWR